MDIDTQQALKQNLSKNGGVLCEPTAIQIWCPTVSADVLLQLGFPFLGGWWQDLHFGHCKILHSAKHIKKNARKLKTHSD